MCHMLLFALCLLRLVGARGAELCRDDLHFKQQLELQYLCATLGCSLRAAKDADHPDGRSLELVKAFNRWCSDDAVSSYARLSAGAYAAHVEASPSADARTVPAPPVDAVIQTVDPIVRSKAY